MRRMLCSPLHCAVARGDEAEGIVECLLSLGAQAHVRAAKTGASSLHTAAEKGQGAVVRLLLKHGAPHGAVSASGDTALYLAAAAGNVGAAEALVKAGAIDKMLKTMKIRKRIKSEQQYDAFLV